MIKTQKNTTENIKKSGGSVAKDQPDDCECREYDNGKTSRKFPLTDDINIDNAQKHDNKSKLQMRQDTGNTQQGNQKTGGRE